MRQRILAFGSGGARTGDLIDPELETSINTATLDAMTPLQRTILEQALVLAKKLEATADTAPDGRIIDRCKTLLLGDGRDFRRRALEDTLQARVDALEQTGRPAGLAPCGVNGRNKGPSSRSVVTPLGRAALRRTYFACPGCGQGGAHVDRLLGRDGFLTRQATRLVCLTGSRVGFAAAAAILSVCCGWALSDETIRVACEAQAGRVAEFHQTPAAVAGFGEATGEVEF